MKHLKVAFSYCLPMLAVFLVAMAAKQICGETRMYLCTHRYALCTSATCVPQPDNPTQALCSCDIEVGPSMATVPCCRLQPNIDGCGQGIIFSTFSFKQYAQGKKMMKCPGGTPWTWCLNKPCTVDPCDPTKALCLCDIMNTNDSWVTMGGSCDTSTCKKAYWSGASIKDFNEGNVFMTKQQNLTESPVKWCENEIPPK